MRNNEEIKELIKELKDERKTLPAHSMFGTPNWKIIDAQVGIFEKVLKEELDDFDIKEKLDNLLDVYGGEFPNDAVPEAKMHAYDWLLGNTDEL